MNKTIDILEPAEAKVVRRVVKPGNVVIDVGANVGRYTTLFANLVGPAGTVVAFEPAPDNFDRLSESVAGHENVDVIWAAVGDRDGEADLFLAETDGEHQIWDNGRPSVKVPIVRIDSLLFRADFVKVDAQGAELQVVRGMAGLIEGSPKLSVLVEFWPPGLIGMNGPDGPFELIRALRGFGFVLYVPMLDGRLGPVVDDGVAKFLREHPGGVFNVLGLKG